eukprot:9468316-Pyramimonas_sp.AAC.2
MERFQVVVTLLRQRQDVLKRVELRQETGDAHILGLECEAHDPHPLVPLAVTALGRRGQLCHPLQLDLARHVPRIQMWQRIDIWRLGVERALNLRLQNAPKVTQRVWQWKKLEGAGI